MEEMNEKKKCVNFEIREISSEDVSRVYTLESESYPEDEAASYDMLVYRHTEAPDLLLGCYSASELIGFICATRYHGKSLTDEAMHMHIPNGGSVCIHSVVVRTDHRRQGVALKMLAKFISKVTEEQHNVTRILLICKSQLIPLYTRAGFKLNGLSEVVHGKSPWYELQMDMTR